MNEETRIILVNNIDSNEYITITNNFRELEKEIGRLNNIINKAIEYMNNTFDISSVKEMYEIMNKLEEILKGEDK